jgi:MFS family permease
LRQQANGHRYRWLLLLSVMVGTMASVMSSTIVNVAIPDMSRHFVLGQDRAQWVSSGFMVAMTVSMLTTPWLLGRFGYRTTYVGTMVLLLAGRHRRRAGQRISRWCWLARVAEGLAAGVVQPIPAIIMLRAFEPHEQGRASGLFGMGVVLAPGAGAQHRRRAGRLVRLALDLLHGGAVLPGVAGWPTATCRPARRAAPTRRAGRLDWRGLRWPPSARCRCSTAWWNCAAAAHGRPSPCCCWPRVALVASSPGSAAPRHRPRAADEPGLFGYRTFAMGSVVAFIYGTALFGSTYLLPVYMQLALHLPASHVGTILLPAGIVLAIHDRRRRPAHAPRPDPVLVTPGWRCWPPRSR